MTYPLEQFKNAREAAKITFDRVSSWEELNAATMAEADRRFKEATKKYWKEFAVSGVLRSDPKTGGLVLQPFTDLDGYATLGILKKAGLDTSNLKYVRPGERVEGAINLDTGDKFGAVYDESTHTAYFDHHAPGIKEVTSTPRLCIKPWLILACLKKLKQWTGWLDL